VAFGGVGTPLIVFGFIAGVPTETLSVMAGHQLPILSLLVPAYMIRCMCTWRETLAVWPALLVAGGSFALCQFFFATSHVYIPGLELYPMTDIGGGIFSLVLTALFCKVWKPAQEIRFAAPVPTAPTHKKPTGPHGEEAAALLDDQPHPQSAGPLTAGRVALAWMPFVIMSVMLLFSGLVRPREGKGPVTIFGDVRTNYLIPMPTLHLQVDRDPYLHPVKREREQALLLLLETNPFARAVNAVVAEQIVSRPEKAEFNFAWLTAPGTAVFFAALLSMLMLRMSWGDVLWSFGRTFLQMKIPIPTIAVMLGLSYLTRYAGMDATLGVAFASTGMLYPFFAAMLGWLGVFLTGTDAGSNALFGSLQKITATQIHNAGWFGAGGLTLDQAQILICTANSTGGVMGKMIDAQSIVVATAATDQLGKEADIFKAVFWHSLFLASGVGLLTLLQAYVVPFIYLVPRLSP